MKLKIELVPSTCWYSNVRSNVSKDEWDIIRKASYQKAGNKCEICGAIGKDQGFPHNVECHEIWNYDDENKIQKLIGLISLCPLCHKVKHFGLAQIKGEGDLAMNHLMKVNGLNLKKSKKHVHEAFALWHERSDYDWTLDISYLTKFLEEYKNTPWWQKPL